MHQQKRLNPLYRLVALAGLFLLSLGAAAEDFLLPDQAFRIAPGKVGSDSVEVRWDIAKGYYLYRSKFSFRTDAAGISLGEPTYSPSETKKDEIFGEVQVYHDQAVVTIPVQRSGNAPEKFTLVTRSQGCAEGGICYPPHEQQVELKLAAANAEPPSLGDSADGLSALGGSPGLFEEDELLTPEQAFQFNAIVENPSQLRLNWRIADGTYLYKDKVAVSLENAEGVALGEFELPAAEIKSDTPLPDGTIGDVAVYHKEIDLLLPLLRSSEAATPITLVAKYQGCAERGICYPPVTQKIKLDLPALAAGSTLVSLPDQPAANNVSSPGGTDEVIAEQDRLSAILEEGNTWLIIALFFGAGLALAFTPCVFPMIPILSGIITGQGSSITTGRAFTLSAVYVLAMAVTYTVAGVLAGLFGENLQAAFQNPWILSIFAGLFVLLALSMFGFYELQLPSSLQSRLTEISNKQQGGTLAGVAIMGLLSALIVGPCVAPPLAGALIYIGKTGDAVLGGTALFFLALGMGAPLIAIGTSAGKLLPRAGAWMDTVKAVFGVGMLAVAILLLERILPPAAAMVLWGLLLIGSAVYLGALRDLPVEASGWSKLWKGLGVALLIYGGLMLTGAAAGGKDTLQPLRGVSFGGSAAGVAAEGIEFTRIKSVADLEAKVAAASAAGKPVMLDFYADWCTYCIKYERYVFPDPRVVAALSGFELLQADVTESDDIDKALLKHLGISAPPAILFYGADGNERRNYRIVGEMGAEEFAAHVTKAVSQ